MCYQTSVQERMIPLWFVTPLVDWLCWTDTRSLSMLHAYCTVFYVDRDERLCRYSTSTWVGARGTVRIRYHWWGHSILTKNERLCRYKYDGCELAVQCDHYNITGATARSPTIISYWLCIPTKHIDCTIAGTWHSLFPTKIIIVNSFDRQKIWCLCRTIVELTKEQVYNALCGKYLSHRSHRIPA